MLRKLLLTASAVLGCGFFIVTGQRAAPPAVYTAAQAAAGRTAYESSCGKCHTSTLLGRKGEAGELPPLGSLPANTHVLQANGARPGTQPLTTATAV